MGIKTKHSRAKHYPCGGRCLIIRYCYRRDKHLDILSKNICDFGRSNYPLGGKIQIMEGRIQTLEGMI